MDLGWIVQAVRWSAVLVFILLGRKLLCKERESGGDLVLGRVRPPFDLLFMLGVLRLVADGCDSIWTQRHSGC